MRRLLSLSLLPLLLLALGALPAAADSMRRPAVARGVAPHALHHGRRAAGVSFFAPAIWDQGDWVSAVAPRALVVLTFAPAPAPAPAAAPPHAKVEITAHGVTVVRGPGTHHLAP